MIPSKLAITERALLQRLNRKLATKGLCVKRVRGERLREEYGDCYLIDLYRNVIAEKDLDLETMGRKYKVLKPWETIHRDGRN